MQEDALGDMDLKSRRYDAKGVTAIQGMDIKIKGLKVEPGRKFETGSMKAGCTSCGQDVR